MVSSKSKNRRQKIGESDIEVIEHVYRYRLTVPEALACQGFADSPEKAKNLLRRLRSRGYLNSCPLYGTRNYHHLTKVAANIIGKPESAARPLAEQTKLDSFAMLSFCAMREPFQHKLTLDEFKENFPQLFRNGERPNYYVHTSDGKTKLGYIRVDRGGLGRWDRLLNRCRGDISTRSELPEFRRLIDSGGFVFTLITALPQKRQKLEAALDESPFPCPFNIVAIPDLLELVAPLPK